MKYLIRVVFSFILAAACFAGCKNHATRDGEALNVKKTKNRIIVDGLIDTTWNKCKWISIGNVRLTKVAVVSKTDISGAYKILWDDENCYFLFLVHDNIKFYRQYSSAIEKAYDQQLSSSDGVAVFFDTKNSKSVPVNIKYYNYKKLTYNEDTIATSISTPLNSQIKGINFAQKDTKDGYLFEMAFPWKLLGVTAKEHLEMGMEINIIDNDNVTPGPDMIAKRQTVLAWHDNSHSNPSLRTDIYGTIVLTR